MEQIKNSRSSLTQSVKDSPSMSQIFSTGCAMFGMFFGAGNIVFPLILGQFAQQHYLIGILGLILTGVATPLLGLLAILLFEGDYSAFFARIGKVPGFLLLFLILGLLGPFGATPRCIIISFSTLSTFQPLQGISLPLFSALSCFLIFLLTYRPLKIVTILGSVLTPILLIALSLVIFFGILHMPEMPQSLVSAPKVFKEGFLSGYNTMDLLAAFFFSSMILACLRKQATGSSSFTTENSRKLFSTALWGSCLAALLLSLIYLGFTYIASGYGSLLASAPPQELLGLLAQHILGSQAGLFTGIIVAFACLTTEIALASVFAEFLSKEVFRKKISYPLSLAMTLGATFLFSILQFEGISRFLVPILECCYPALIVLTIVNLLHKLYSFKSVKVPFYLTLAITLFWYFLF